MGDCTGVLLFIINLDHFSVIVMEFLNSQLIIFVGFPFNDRKLQDYSFT